MKIELDLRVNLREYYAGLAMQGQISCCDLADSSASAVAKAAVEYADALIAKLKEGEK